MCAGLPGNDQHISCTDNICFTKLSHKLIVPARILQV